MLGIECTPILSSVLSWLVLTKQRSVSALIRFHTMLDPLRTALHRYYPRKKKKLCRTISRRTGGEPFALVLGHRH